MGLCDSSALGEQPDQHAGDRFDEPDEEQDDESKGDDESQHFNSFQSGLLLIKEHVFVTSRYHTPKDLYTV